MRAYVFTSKTNNDVVVIIAQTSKDAVALLEGKLRYVKEGATDYILNNYTNCNEGSYCTAIII